MANAFPRAKDLERSAVPDHAEFATAVSAMFPRSFLPGGSGCDLARHISLLRVEAKSGFAD